MTSLETRPFTAKIVVLISVDSLRADRVDPKTMPRAYRFIEKGYSFRHSYSNVPYTGAAHATMLTSLYACNHGKTDNSWILAQHIRSVAQILTEQGIDTAAVVSAAPLRREQSGFERGFNFYVQDDRHAHRLEWAWVSANARALRLGLPDLVPVRPYLLASDVLNRAQAQIQLAQAEGRQLFLFIHLMDVHEPYSVPRHSSFGVPRLDALLVLRKLYKGQALSGGEVQIFRAIYDHNVKIVDQALAKFLKAVLSDSTAVLITSDHGENAFEKKRRDTGRPYAGKNRTLYEPEVHVPLALLSHQIKSPLVADNVVSHIDLAPTVLDLLGIKAHAGFQGRPLWERNISSPVFMERLDWSARREVAWLKWPWKIIVTPGPQHDGGQQANQLFELFDLEMDPHETTNLYERDSLRSQGLGAEMLQFISGQSDFFRECHSAPSPDSDALVLERLRLLGYVE